MDFVKYKNDYEGRSESQKWACSTKAKFTTTRQMNFSEKLKDANRTYYTESGPQKSELRS